LETIIIDGKKAASVLQEKLAGETALFTQATGLKPCLAAVMVGNNGASQTYVEAKMASCEKVGFESRLIRFEDNISEQNLLAEIDKLNADPTLHGFIVQLPLPKHISVDLVIDRVSPEKDVDGFHPLNMGRMAKNQPAFAPATPWGIMQLLDFYQIPTEGKNVVVLGRSQIVGLPISLLLARSGNPGNATVTICHSKTVNLQHHTLQADIIVAALGIPEFLTGEMVKQGVTIIDVGLTRLPDASKKSGYRLAGDVHFESVAPKSAAITPVPGGVGPMTITALMQNTLLAARNQLGMA